MNLLISNYKLWFLRWVHKIKIGDNNIIFKNAIIRRVHGGTIEIGDNNEFLYSVLILSYGGMVKIGNHCSVNPYAIIYGHGKGTLIGNNVLIAAHTVIVPVNHNFEHVDDDINKQGLNSKGIVIEDNVWIGAGCQILDNVRIGNGSIVAAGSVVNKDVPPFSIVGGVPARVLKYRK